MHAHSEECRERRGCGCARGAAVRSGGAVVGGAGVGAHAGPCPRCMGAGEVERYVGLRRTGSGFGDVEEVFRPVECPECHGSCVTTCECGETAVVQDMYGTPLCGECAREVQ